MRIFTRLFLGMLALVLLAGGATAQLADRKVLTLEAAREMAAAAEAEAVKNNWNVVIAIVDEAGFLVHLHRLDNTQVASIDIAIAKARTSAQFRRPTKVFEDAVAGGRNALLAVPGLMPLDGGIPITVDNRVIGAVGLSGVTAQQDAQIAKAGVDALVK